MNWSKLTDEALAEWRALPMTRALKAAHAEKLRLMEESFKAAAWAGTPWTEAQRLGLKQAIGMTEDIFEASADDLRVIMESDE